MKNGSFVESTFGEYLDEEEELLELLDLKDCYLFGLHPSNIVRMHGNLPEDKQAMLELVRKKKKRAGEQAG